MSSKAVIESIARSAGKLVEQNRRLAAEVARLSSANEKLRENNRRIAAENAALEGRLTVIDLAAGLAGGKNDGNGTKIARARVGRLMREVDKCIALINRE